MGMFPWKVHKEKEKESNIERIEEDLINGLEELYASVEAANADQINPLKTMLVNYYIIYKRHRSELKNKANIKAQIKLIRRAIKDKKKELKKAA